MKQKDFLIILIPSFILVVLWVIFSIYHNYVTNTIKAPLTSLTIPIEGKFDTAIIEALKNRQKVDPLYQIQATPMPTGELTPTPEPSPTTSDQLLNQTELVPTDEPIPTDQGTTP